MQNSPGLSIIDGIGNGLGYALILMITAFLREFFGSGALFGKQIMPLVTEGGWYEPNGLMLLSPAAFFIIGLLIWLLRIWKPDQIEEE
jgi:Na+-transporting NADH:ubiquinone oxidoreductase subunit D